MRRFLLLSVAAFGLGMSFVSMPAVADSDTPVLMTGGKSGDYYRYFGPPVLKVLDKAWVDATIAESDGTPASMDYVLQHQTSYMLGQGDVTATLLQDPKYNGKLKILPTKGLGNEAVLAIMNDKTFHRSQGSWAVVAKHARQVRFVTASEGSGPGRTFKELQAMDPDGLGRANVKFMSSMDDAIKAVAEGRADVALMVQFGNPDNPRFKAINDAHLHFASVITSKMKGLEIPDVGPAFTLCTGVQVSKETAIDTACTPIQVLTGASNDNPDLFKAFASVTPDDFAPHDSGFAALWKRVKVASSTAWQAAASKADELANRAADNL